MNTVERIVDRFGLKPHPEGGFFREVYRSSVTLAHPAVDGSDIRRCAGTHIYFLLGGEEFSAFHRVRVSDEIWHLYAGGPLELHTIDADGRYALTVLTTDLERGAPTAVVPAGCWQAARLVRGSAWAFTGCTVTPGFAFADFEMPAARALLDAHPAHAPIIRALTRK
jgi:hypothetical protein